MQHDAERCRRLFVYGTLRRDMALHAHLTHLGAAFEAEGRVRGELFDLGRYPGARPAKGEENWVTGELFRLRQPEHDLRRLDEVEGFDPCDPKRSEFVRALADVTLTHGTPCRAWIYWLGPNAGGSRRIAGGDYAAWLARREPV
jgi:gamma-glutamylcyclotransferase (GGCT)/AIG2-like uncharacterized protein YtfP